MNFVLYIVAAVAAYFIGSFNASIFLSKHLIGEDVRKEGSGNAGATNMARVFGLSFGLITLLADFLKAVIATVLCRWLVGDWGLFAGGMMCLVGHCFPVMYDFKGGKGISVGAALALMIDWRVFVTVVLVFAVGVLISRKVSLGSVLAAVSIVPATFIFTSLLPGKVLAVCGMVLVVWRHSSNIVRLIKGTEPDFRAAKGHKLSELSDKDKK